MIVCKFGGSILTNYTNLSAIREIFLSDKNRKIAVISAIGPTFNNSIKLTDLLIKLANTTKSLNYDQIFSQIEEKISLFANELKVDLSEIVDFNILKQNLKEANYNFIVSRGEYYTAKICAKFFGTKILYPEEFLIGSTNSSIDLLASKRNLLNKTFTKAVVPGFYFCDSNKKIALFNRGGGDVTGAIIANILNANLYENYTCVNGILNCDPKICTKASTIKKLSYAQCYELSLNGATVFAKESIKFLCKKNIKTKIINLNSANKNYTIMGKRSHCFSFSKIVNLSEIELLEKHQKSKIKSDILNVFMFDKNSITTPFKIKNKIYFESNLSPKKTKLIQLTIFLKNTSFIYSKIKRLCYAFDIICYKKYVHPLFNKNKYFFIGNINELFLNELMCIIEQNMGNA